MSRDALVVGINTYQYMQPLKSPSADAEAVASILEQYGEFTVKRLPEAIDRETNRICVAQNIPISLDELEKALVQLFKPTGSSIPDIALFFFSGHGLRRDLGIQEGFLCTSETGAGSGVRGLSLQWLRRLILESEVRQQVILLDCCYSGELFNLTEADPGHLGRGRDRCFIAASREFELAYEETAGKHGVFTRALLDALNPSRPLDGMVNNTELSDFIAKQLTGTVQKPIFSNSGGAIILTRAVRPMPVTKKSKGTVCPYRGLSYFDCNEEDPKYFYGRAAITDQLIEKVRQSNFVAVLGPSGSGKSSVVRAGLLHQLKVGRKLSDSETWPVHIFRPGEHPLKSLAMAFVNPSLSNIEVAAQLDQAEDLIAKGAVGLDRLVRATLTSGSSSRESSASSRLVLVADQFEEVFSLCRDENERDKFLECLLGVLSLSPNSVCLILTMRADFLAKCAEREYSGLSALIQTNMVTVTPMTTEEFEQAIVKPAEKVDIAIEPELIKTMVEDVKHSPGSLPLLQYTLTELWNRGEGEKFTLTEYSRMGGVKGSLAHRADEVYQTELANDQERAVARRIFIQLTQLGEGTEDTRRQILKQSLVKSPEDEQTVEKVIQTLADAKLIVTGEIRGKDGDKTKAAVVDVAHEALIRHWPRLRGWLDENREDIRFHRRLAEQARHWDERGKPDGLLWRPPDLHLLRQFYSYASEDMTASEIKFFKQSELIEEGRQAAAKSRVRNTKIALVFMLVLALIGGIASFVAFQQRDIAKEKEKEAQIEKAKAEKQRKLAVARQLAAQATLSLTSPPTDFIKGTLLAAESLKQEQTLEGSRALKKALGLLPPKVTRLKHEGNVSKLAFSPDGQQLATLMNFGVSAASGALRIWDAKGDSLIAEVAHDGWVTDVAFSADGRFIASSGWDHAVIVTNAITGKQVYRQVLDAPVFALSFSPDSQKLAIGTRDGKICIKMAGEGADILCMKHDAALVDVAFTPNGDQLVTASEDKTARVWKVETGQETRRFSHGSKVSRMTLSPDGLLLATSVEMDAKAWVWDIASGQLMHELAHDDEVIEVIFSFDGMLMLTGSRDKTARIWDTQTGTQLKRLNIGDWVGRIAFSSDDSHFVTIRANKNDAIVWRTNTAAELFRAVHDKDVMSAAFYPADDLLTTSGGDQTIRIWDIVTGKQLRRLKQRGDVDQVYFSPDGKRLAATIRLSGYHYSWGCAMLWNSNTEEPIRQFSGHPKEMTDIEFSQSGEFLATGDYGGKVRVWDLQSGSERSRLSHDDAIRSIQFAPGDRLVTETENQTASWDLETGRRLSSFSELGGVYALQISQNGKHAATLGLYDGTIRNWNTESGKELIHLKIAHETPTPVRCRFSLSPDGRLLAVLEVDKETVKIIDLGTGELYAELNHEVEIDKFIFDHNSDSLAVQTKDETVWLWDLRSCKVRFRLQNFDDGKPIKVKEMAFSLDDNLIRTGDFIGETVAVWDAKNGNLAWEFTRKVTLGREFFKFSNNFRYVSQFDTVSRTLNIWDIQSGDRIHEIQLDKYRPGAWPVFSPDATRMAFATRGVIQVWNVLTWELLYELYHDEPRPGASYLAFSPSGEFLATAGYDMTARVWNLATGTEVIRFQHNSWVSLVEFAADGKVLISHDRSYIVRAWDIFTGGELFRLAHGGTYQNASYNHSGTHVVTQNSALTQVWDVITGEKITMLSHDGGVTITSLSGDGHRLATVINDPATDRTNVVNIWDIKTGRELFQLKHNSSFRSVTFSFDDKNILTSSADGTIQLWDAATGKENYRLTHEQGVKDVRLSPDQTLLAAVMDNEREIRVWNLLKRQEIARLLHDGKRVEDIVFHPVKPILATADGGETVRLWDLNNVRPEVLRMENDAVVTGNFAITPDAKRLATRIGMYDQIENKYVPVWDLTTGKELYRVVHQDQVRGLALSQDGKWLATASSDKTARVWDVVSGRETLMLEHNQKVHEVKFSPDGRWLATFIGGIVSGIDSYEEEDLLQIWDATNGSKTDLAITGYINDFNFSPDGEKIITAEGSMRDRQNGAESDEELRLGYFGVRIWDVISGKELLRIVENAEVYFASFNPEGSKMATRVLSNGPVRLWDPKTGRLLKELVIPPIRRMVFSPSWRFLATNGSENIVQIWIVETGEKKGELFLENIVGDILFSPDEKYLATQGSVTGGGTVLIWDWLQKRPLIELNAESVYSLKFTPDGSRIITAGGRAVKVWHWRAEDLVADACARIERNFTRKEWRTYFGDESYRRTCPDLPEPEN